MGIKESLESIDAFSDQVDLATQISEELESVKTTDYVPALLAMFERNANEDDYGVFSSLANYIEQFGRKDTVDGVPIGTLLVESVRRQPAWPTLDLLAGFTDPDTRAETLVALTADERLDEDTLYTVKSHLQKVVDTFEDDLKAPVLASARSVLAAD